MNIRACVARGADWARLAGLLAAAALPAMAVGQSCGPGWLPGMAAPGVGQIVFASARMPNGDLILGGSFSEAGRIPSTSVVRWDGSNWSSMGPALRQANGSAAVVQLLKVTSHGDLVVGGNFTNANGATLNGVARWDGSSWQALGTGVAGGSNPLVLDFVELPNGDLVMGGIFASAGGVAAPGIARWDGSAWHALDGFPGVGGGSIGRRPNGDLVVVSGNGSGTPIVLLWDGASWRQIASSASPPSISALAISSSGQVYVGGGFQTIDGVPANHIARWSGSSWSPMGQGVEGAVESMAVLPDGSLIVGGAFTRASGLRTHNIVRWSGSSWTSFGTGLRGAPGSVNCVTPLGGSSFLASGIFFDANGVAVRNTAMWDGSRWRSVGPGFNGSVYDIMVHSSGDLIVGGSIPATAGGFAQGIARWDGLRWNALGSGLIYNPSISPLTCIAELPGGDIVVGGSIFEAGGAPARGIARWNGTNWSTLGSGVGDEDAERVVRALCVLPNGDLVAGGGFVSAGGVPALHIARWNGVQWQPLGGGLNNVVYALLALPNGDLLAGGRFSAAGGVNAHGIARWNGSEWSAFGGSLLGLPYIYDLALTPSGGIVAAGEFREIGGVPASSLAVWNGQRWLALEPGLGGRINRVRPLADGTILAAGPFNGPDLADQVALWNGASWQPLGGGVDLEVRALAPLPGGEVAIGGDFVTVGGLQSAYFARWSPTGRPLISVHPQSLDRSCGQAASFSVACQTGYGVIQFTWRRDGQPLAGDDPRVSVVTAGLMSTLTIAGLRLSDAGQFDCVVGNDCGSDTSRTAVLAFTSCCPADFNDDGFLDFFDYSEFVTAFETGVGNADFNGDGFVDFFDYGDFVAAFEAGC